MTAHLNISGAELRCNTETLLEDQSKEPPTTMFLGIRPNSFLGELIIYFGLNSKVSSFS